MTAKQRKEIVGLRAEARKSGRKNFAAVCQFTDSNFKNRILRRLQRASVPPCQLSDAYHDVLQRSGQRIYQVRHAIRFPGWLRRISQEVARRYRTPYIKPSHQAKSEHHALLPPRQIGSKFITVRGEQHEARVFEPCFPPAESPRRQLRLVELSDSAVMKSSMSNRPHYTHKIDAWSAIGRLPSRWANALLLTAVERRTAPQVAEILGCTVPRVYRLVQLAKQRMRVLMPGYD